MQPINRYVAAITLVSLSLGAISQAHSADAPPWIATAKLKQSAVPPVYLSQWRKAKNRAHCAPLVLAGVQREPGLKVRRATFYGGWAVAYDTPRHRSAFGIAGTGVKVGNLGPHSYRFPNRLAWADGSYAEYGLEGGVGPNVLAYLTVSGQGCLYNLWSKRGKRHLEALITTLRQIERPR